MQRDDHKREPDFFKKTTALAFSKDSTKKDDYNLFHQLILKEKMSAMVFTSRRGLILPTTQ